MNEFFNYCEIKLFNQWIFFLVLINLIRVAPYRIQRKRYATISASICVICYLPYVVTFFCPGTRYSSLLDSSAFIEEIIIITKQYYQLHRWDKLTQANVYQNHTHVIFFLNSGNFLFGKFEWKSYFNSTKTGRFWQTNLFQNICTIFTEKEI